MSEIEHFFNAVLLTDMQHLEALAWLAVATAWFCLWAAAAFVLLVHDIF